ncbi:MAG: YbhN family protein [Actinomycetota bacterium]|nr:YbhN family protein [Actinomycetota bacterium]
MTTPDGSPASTPDDDIGDTGLPKDRPRGIIRRIFSGLLSYGVVIVALLFLFSKMEGAENTGDAFALMTWEQVVVISLLGVFNLFTNWPPFVVALKGLRLREAAVTNTASAALSNTVPEGGAVATGLNFAMLRSWGFALDDITSEVIVTGVWSQMTKFTLLAVSLAAVSYYGPAPENLDGWALLLIVLVVLAAVILGLILRSEHFARKLGSWTNAALRMVRKVIKRMKPPDMTTELPRFRAQMVQSLRTCWFRLSLTMIASQLTTIFVLGVACRMQGLDQSTISWWTITLAYSCVVLASLLIPTPGGLGVAEVVLVAVLGYGLPESQQTAVLAAVLLYRLATFLVPIPIGLVTYLYWRRSTKWRRPVDSRRVYPLDA